MVIFLSCVLFSALLILIFGQNGEWGGDLSFLVSTNGIKNNIVRGSPLLVHSSYEWSCVLMVDARMEEDEDQDHQYIYKHSSSSILGIVAVEHFFFSHYYIIHTRIYIYSILFLFSLTTIGTFLFLLFVNIL